jgi:hypothetical protein
MIEVGEFTSNSEQGEPGMTNKPNPASAASPSSPWKRVYLRATLCLVAGLGAGYLIRGGQSAAPPVQLTAQPGSAAGPPDAAVGRAMSSAGQATQMTPTHASAMGGGRMPSLGEMRQMADTQAAPLLDKLKNAPNDSSLLSEVGAIYHTTHQFKEAAIYYQRAVKGDPKNVALRTKLASSLYRSGDVDGAIAQLNQGLKCDPSDANSLFDLGVIKLHGKQDGKGALIAWQQLLKRNPQLSADRKATVQEMMAEVLTMLSDQSGIQGVRSNDGHKPNLN